jgi:hypothetical protein
MALVLAIEPDHRQAAIVKRIVREKVLADVAVVDSRDAALEAMRTTVPDVLLLSALLSPRDEDELVAHLRARRDAEHLQTHTIPQLASTIGGSEAKPKGLLSAFKRKKGPESAPAGCDPDLFAEEIRVYLERASERKREGRSAPALEPIARIAAPPSAPAAAEPAAATESAGGSSWESPFEWRPTKTATSSATLISSPSANPQPLIVQTGSHFADPSFATPDMEAAIVQPPPAIIEVPAPTASSVAARDVRGAIVDPIPAGLDLAPAAFDSAPVVLDAPPVVIDPAPARRAATAAPRVKYPLTVRTAKGWWFIDGKFLSRRDEKVGSDSDSDLRGVLGRVSLPSTVAIAYAEGCRVRRVRLA